MLQSTSLKVGSSGLSGMRCVVCMMMFIEVALETVSESSVESYDQGHILDCTQIYTAIHYLETECYLDGWLVPWLCGRSAVMSPRYTSNTYALIHACTECRKFGSGTPILQDCHTLITYPHGKLILTKLYLLSLTFLI